MEHIHKKTGPNYYIPHMDALAMAFFNDGHTTQTVHIAWPACSDNIHMALIDLVNDLKMTGEQFLQKLNWPAFQGLRKDSVVLKEREKKNKKRQNV